MPPVHLLQHPDAVHPRHDHIQQHHLDARAVLLQQLQARRAVGRLQIPVFVSQHGHQQLPVQRRVVHHQQQRGLLLRRTVIRRLSLQNDAVLPLLGPVHQPVGPQHGVGHCLVPGHDAADTGRQPQAGLLRQPQRRYPRPDILQHRREVVLSHPRQQQKELVAAVAHHLAVHPGRVLHHLRRGRQELVAAVVAVGVVAQLQIVQIDDGHAAPYGPGLHMHLVVAAAVHAGQRVHAVLPHDPPGDQQRVRVQLLNADVVPLHLPVAGLKFHPELLALRAPPEEALQIPCVDIPVPHRRLLGDGGAAAVDLLPQLRRHEPALPHAVRQRVAPVYAEPPAPPVVFHDDAAVGPQRVDEHFLRQHTLFPPCAALLSRPAGPRRGAPPGGRRRTAADTGLLYRPPPQKARAPPSRPAKSRSAAPFRAALLPYMMDVHFSRFSSRTTVSTFAVPGNMSTAAARTAS